MSGEWGLPMTRPGAMPETRGGWRTIAADPPWRYQDRNTRLAPDGQKRTARGGYSTMTAAEILALPIAEIAAPRAHLYLWTMDAHLPLALECINAWGFDWKRSIVWVKRGTSGKLAFGAGHYYRTAHELCLFATRGGLQAQTRSLRTVFEAPRRAHSEKPAELYRMAELVSPGPRLELFARALRPGWTTWGLECPEVAA